MPDGTATSNLYRPKLATILAEGYGLADLRRDAAAGLTVAVLALPLSMAIAVASGVSPERGLYTAIVGGFVVSALVVTSFVTWLAHALRRRDRELAHLREQFTRNEGILALATHAASVAHELNTPLATLTLLLEQQHEQYEHDANALVDIELMRTLVNACRDRVRELAAPATGMGGHSRDIAAELERVIERWRLLRPEVQLERRCELAAAPRCALDAGIGHLLQALLNNAADASARDGSTRVDLELKVSDSWLFGVVRDYGRGFDHDASPLPGTLFRTTKPDGLGVGLALSHATVERLGGALAMEAAQGQGVQVRFSLPLAA